MRRLVLGSLTLLVVGAAALAATQPAAPNSGGRPRDPWVFRCVLDQRPRMVVIALHEHLWVAYDAATCSLYKAWKGDVKFQGAVYDHVHGPQPVVRGEVMLDQTAPDWNVRRMNELLESKVIWKGYRIQNDRVTLLYQIQLGDSQSIDVEEQVEATDAKGNEISLERRFTARNVPQGAVVSMAIPLRQAGGEKIQLHLDTRLGDRIETDAAVMNVPLLSNETTVVSSRLHVPAGTTTRENEERRGVK